MATVTTIRAIVVEAMGKADITLIPMPKLRDDYILVKPVAVALNPTDRKNVDFLMGGRPTGTIVGCDFAGIVERVGSKVKKPFKKGDRITGPVHGS